MSIDFSKAPEGAMWYYGNRWYKHIPYIGFFVWRRLAQKWEKSELQSGIVSVEGDPVAAPELFASVEDAQPTSSTHDPVNSPSHYASGGVECIEAIKASMSHEAFLGYLKGNVQKYLWRYEKKANPVEDLKKAQWYLARLTKEQEGE